MKTILKVQLGRLVTYGDLIVFFLCCINLESPIFEYDTVLVSAFSKVTVTQNSGIT